MSWYNFLSQSYGSFIGLFPGGIQWAVSLLIVLGVIGALMSLVRRNILFILASIVLIPLMLPVAARFVGDAGHTFLWVVGVLHLVEPQR